MFEVFSLSAEFVKLSLEYSGGFAGVYSAKGNFYKVICSFFFLNVAFCSLQREDTDVNWFNTFHCNMQSATQKAPQNS